MKLLLAEVVLWSIILAYKASSSIDNLCLPCVDIVLMETLQGQKIKSGGENMFKKIFF